MRRPSQPIVGYSLAVLGMFLLYLAACSAPAPLPAAVVPLEQPAGGQYLCELSAEGASFRLACNPASEPTPTLAPTRTPTSEPATATPEPPANTPEPTPTSTPEPVAHDPTAWHPLTEELGHHHGVNPADYIPIFGDALADYLATYGSISYPWQTPNENAYKHNGYIWLYTEAAGGCEQFNTSGSPNCVTHTLVQVHSIGTGQAALTRMHSQYAFVRTCTPDGTQCGVTATGGWADYGLTHAPYKEAICDKVTDPPGLSGDDDRFQPPYTANPLVFTAGRVVSQFWNSLGPAQNLINEGWYPDGDLRPNHILGLAWSSPDAWQTLSPASCADPLAATTVGGEYNHSRFHIFTVELDNLPPAPFAGWTNRWGHVVEGCTEAGLDCVPLVVGEGVPDGFARLNRQVNQGNPDLYAPRQEFDVFCGDQSCGWIQFPAVPGEMLP